MPRVEPLMAHPNMRVFAGDLPYGEGVTKLISGLLEIAGSRGVHSHASNRARIAVAFLDDEISPSLFEMAGFVEYPPDSDVVDVLNGKVEPLK